MTYFVLKNTSWLSQEEMKEVDNLVTEKMEGMRMIYDDSAIKFMSHLGNNNNEFSAAMLERLVAKRIFDKEISKLPTTYMFHMHVASIRTRSHRNA